MSDSPHLVYSLQAAHNDYRPGLQVNGIIWQESYYEYDFSIGNPSETSSVIDLRLEYQLPWTLINLRFARQDGCEGLAFKDNSLQAVRGVGDRVIEILPARTNVVLISASKLFPEASCHGKLVLNTTLPNGLPLQDGKLSVSYRYLGADGRETKKSDLRRIEVTNVEQRLVRIDPTSLKGAQKSTTIYQLDGPTQSKRTPRGVSIQLQEVSPSNKR